MNTDTNVVYPVAVKHYEVRLKRNAAQIVLDGLEQPANPNHLRCVGVVNFSDIEPTGERDTIVPGGFLEMNRPFAMLSGVLHLLQHQQSLQLHGDGTFDTLPTPVGGE